ncbi:MAG: hypothetical protein U9N45_07300, partial [Gemmatimonadota bacterium]|nr:hypothetical protein [Gemmatimonadota bacterium]
DAFCPGAARCDYRQKGPDPCAGCKVRARLAWRPKMFATIYAHLLADYIEAFRPRPEQVSWLEFEIYQAFLTARAQHVNTQEKKAWKERSVIYRSN